MVYVTEGTLVGFSALVPIPKEGRAASCRPSSVLAPETALGSVPTVALSSAPVEVVVGAFAPQFERQLGGELVLQHTPPDGLGLGAVVAELADVALLPKAGLAGLPPQTLIV